MKSAKEIATKYAGKIVYANYGIKYEVRVVGYENTLRDDMIVIKFLDVVQFEASKPITFYTGVKFVVPIKPDDKIWVLRVDRISYIEEKFTQNEINYLIDILGI